MQERNANNPRGIDRGPQRIVSNYSDESIIAAIPSSFTGGADGVSSRDAFQRNIFARRKPQIKPAIETKSTL